MYVERKVTLPLGRFVSREYATILSSRGIHAPLEIFPCPLHTINAILDPFQSLPIVGRQPMTPLKCRQLLNPWNFTYCVLLFTMRRCWHDAITSGVTIQIKSRYILRQSPHRSIYGTSNPAPRSDNASNIERNTSSRT